MAQRPHLDTPWKNCFIGTVHTGKSLQQAALDYKIALSTAHDLYTRFEQTGLTHRHGGSGRPCNISD